MAVTITEAEESLIRGKLVGDLETVAEIDRVIPAPVYFLDASEYWRSINLVSRPSTQVAIETSHISAWWVCFRGFVDIGGKPHSPLTELTYEFYGFSQYDQLREDTNATADALARRMLKYHNDFISAILQVKGKYQGDINLGVLDTARFARQFTTPIVVEEFVTDRGPCEFIGGVEGHIIRLTESVNLQLKEC